MNKTTGPRPQVASIPGIKSGDPCILGTRVLAETVYAEHLASASEADILQAYPTLPAGVLAAVLEWSKTYDGVTWLANYRT